MSSNDFNDRFSGGVGKFGGKLAVILIGLGLVAVGIGWNGVASNISLVRQVPYAVSGLGIGLALVIVGSALMVLQGYREERTKLEAKLDQVIVALGGRASGYGVGGDTPADLAGLVVAGSASFHRAGCRLVDGREQVEYLTVEEAQGRFLQPCRVCNPAPANV